MHNRRRFTKPYEYKMEKGPHGFIIHQVFIYGHLYSK